jgi:hypothetical protein
MLFQMSGHVPPLLRDFDQLLLDKWIASLFGSLFALERLGQITRGTRSKESTSPTRRI